MSPFILARSHRQRRHRLMTRAVSVRLDVALLRVHLLFLSYPVVPRFPTADASAAPTPRMMRDPVRLSPTRRLGPRDRNRMSTRSFTSGCDLV